VPNRGPQRLGYGRVPVAALALSAVLLVATLLLYRAWRGSRVRESPTVRTFPIGVRKNEPAEPKKPAHRAGRICIDPGHPSEVGMGTQGKKLTEIHAAWIEAQLLKQYLEEAGFQVVLTKSDENQFVRNRDRAEVANRFRADLMVRLHCDSASGSGFTSYFPSQRGSVSGIGGPAADVLLRSKALANVFHAALGRELRGSLRDNGLKTDLSTGVGAKQGALTGSIFSKVPVVLVEMVVLTNPKDEAFISSKSGQVKMARALAAATSAAIEAG
jgi:N-acetylmuramoyl-L-alanine amidase